MGWFTPRAATTPDEQVTLEALADLLKGRRAVGGKVTVTTRRLLFTPSWVDLATGGRVMTLDLTDIGGVEIVPANRLRVRPPGVWRPVVRIDHHGGATYLHVRKPDRLAAAMSNRR
jgi:hypothetical protein